MRKKIFNGFSYAIFLLFPFSHSHRTHVTHYESIFRSRTRIKLWEKRKKEKFLCFIKTLKRIYTSIFAFVVMGRKWEADVCVQYWKKFHKTSSKVFRTENCHLLCYDRFLYPPSCFAVKKPGKFMWKCKQLLCISFATFTAFTTSARFIFLCF